MRASESHPSRGLPGNKAVNPYRRTVETSKTSKSSASDEKAPLIDVEVKEIIGCKEPILIDLCTEDSRCSLGSDRKEVVRLSIEPVNDVFSDQCDEVKTPDGPGAMICLDDDDDCADSSSCHIGSSILYSKSEVTSI